MIDVDYFYKQACRDLRVADLLCDEKYFDTAAYLYQQSLEKRIKSVVYRHQLTENNARKLNHLPLISLWCDLSNESELKLSPILDSILQFLKKAVQHKQIWWKFSLGIASQDDENEIKIVYEKTMGLQLENVKILSDNFLKQVKTIISHLPEKKKQNIQTLYYNYITPILENKSVTSLHTITEILPKFFEMLKNILIDNKKHIRNFQCWTPKMLHNILLAWVCSFFILLLKMYPHEEYGRYPLNIGDKSSLSIYAEKEFAVRKLGLEIKNACDQLDELTCLGYIFEKKSHRFVK